MTRFATAANVRHAIARTRSIRVLVFSPHLELFRARDVRGATIAKKVATPLNRAPWLIGVEKCLFVYCNAKVGEIEWTSGLYRCAVKKVGIIDLKFRNWSMIQCSGSRRICGSRPTR